MTSQRVEQKDRRFFFSMINNAREGVRLAREGAD